MSEFLVETYASRQAIRVLAETVEELALAAERVSEPGAEVGLLGALFLPGEETCFYLYQAASVDTVGAAVARGRLDFERVTEAVWIRPSRRLSPAGDIPSNG